MTSYKKPIFYLQTSHVIKDQINQKGLDLINSIEKTQTKVLDYKHEVIILHPTLDKEKDIRITIFNRFNNLFFSTKLSLIFIETELNNKNWWASNFSTLRSKEIYSQLQEYVNWTKHHFGMSVFIQTEYFSRIILKALDPSACNNSKSEFKTIYTSLNSRLNINVPEVIALYDLIRLVRNTIHNDGIYRSLKSNNETITYKGTIYSFTQDKLIDFVTWNFLVDMTDDIIFLINSIIENNQISTLDYLIT